MPDPIQQDEQDGRKTARKKQHTPLEGAEPVPAPEPTLDTGTGRHEPYPGAAFFHAGRHSPVFAAMGRRLEQEGCTDGRHLGPDWTTAHRDAFAAWQRRVRPKNGGTSGIPDQAAWDALKVPRVTPLPRQEKP